MSSAKGFLKNLGEEMQKDRATGLAAEQAYYYMLSIFPVLILLLSIIPYLSIEPQTAVSFIKSILPSQTANLLEENVIDLVTTPNGGLLTVGILGTLWSASNGIQAFIHAMNIAYDVEDNRSFIKVRLLAIVLTIGLLVAFIISLALPIFGNVIVDWIKSFVPISSGFEILFTILRWVVAVVVISIVLSGLYRFAPNKSFAFKHVIPGAAIATVLWQVISFGFSFYVSNFGNYSATYGSLGGVIVLMIWLYLTGLILVIGGEINALFHKRNIQTEAIVKHPKRVVKQ
ncbi:YihY/virulence factor BrkB family protein [Priestia filamentosa]|uniref:YihY/virulence factor BrkB family protein n=1 Tax=Priestia filamentosa TaxID=1402861 RepID=UPI0028946FE2|nr:YihY/virulence factor BrkB family protein [Priestia filamentosa]MDT3763434.1 YihY/virulence factor BrkB family protein [Priestia filamentosa]